MRFSWAGWIALFCGMTLLAVDKKLPIEQTSNDLVSVSATAITDREQIKKELGAIWAPTWWW